MIPPLTDAEAISATKRLWRWALKKSCPYQIVIVTGNRYTHVRAASVQGLRLRVLAVNPNDGWRELVHHLSHVFTHRLRPDLPPHSPYHRGLETEMVAEVRKRGWLDGKLKPKPRTPKPKADPLTVELDRIIARIKAWETKAKRAATALTKLRAAEKRLSKRLAVRA